MVTGVGRAVRGTSPAADELSRAACFASPKSHGSRVSRQPKKRPRRITGRRTKTAAVIWKTALISCQRDDTNEPERNMSLWTRLSRVWSGRVAGWVDPAPRWSGCHADEDDPGKWPDLGDGSGA